LCFLSFTSKNTLHLNVEFLFTKCSCKYQVFWKLTEQMLLRSLGE
jgi:hypothetical protein